MKVLIRKTTNKKVSVFSSNQLLIAEVPMKVLNHINTKTLINIQSSGLDLKGFLEGEMAIVNDIGCKDKVYWFNACLPSGMSLIGSRSSILLSLNPKL